MAGGLKKPMAFISLLVSACTTRHTHPWYSIAQMCNDHACVLGDGCMMPEEAHCGGEKVMKTLHRTRLVICSGTRCVWAVPMRSTMNGRLLNHGGAHLVQNCGLLGLEQHEQLWPNVLSFWGGGAC